MFSPEQLIIHTEVIYAELPAVGCGSHGLGHTSAISNYSISYASMRLGSCAGKVVHSFLPISCLF